MNWVTGGTALLVAVIVICFMAARNKQQHKRKAGIVWSFEGNFVSKGIITDAEAKKLPSVLADQLAKNRMRVIGLPRKKPGKKGDYTMTALCADNTNKIGTLSVTVTYL